MNNMRTNLRFFSALIMLFFAQIAFAQVSGTVYGADGSPEPDAMVKVVETGKQTITDLDGNFTIDAKIGQTLEVSGDQLETKKFPISSTKLSLTMKTAQQMADVVVVAYRQKNKEELTGAVTEVKQDFIENTLSPNVLKSLDGAVAGLQVATGSGQPGSGAGDLVLRGVGTAFGGRNPLIVLDGVAYNGTISGINNKDIENITVLKDASATSLYGHRAAGGVIIITTKKAKKGDISFEFDARTAINKRLGNEYDIITDPQEYYQLWWRVLRNSQISAGNSISDAGIFATDNLISSLGYNNYNVADNQLISSSGVFNNNAALLYHDNWFDELFRTAFTNEYYFTVKGGSDNLLSAFSVGYLNEEGIVINSSYERITSRLKLDYKAKEWLGISANLGYINSRTKFARESSGYGNAFDFSRSIAPIYPVYAYDANGVRQYDANGNSIYDFGLTGDGIPGSRTYGSFQNPVFTYLNNKNTTEGNFIDAKFIPTFKITKDVEFKYVFGAEVNFYNNRTLASPLAGDAATANGRASFTDDREITLTHQQLLSWKKSFAEKHNFDLLVGHESAKYTTEQKFSQFENLLEAHVPFLNNAGTFSQLTDYGIEYFVEGYFGEFNYNFNKKYFVNASARRDASSVFSPDNRWGTFYGLSGAWRISEEEFLKRISWINELKLSAGYGTQGNDFVYYPDSGSFGYPTTGTRNYYLWQAQYVYSRSTDGQVIVTPTYAAATNDFTWETNVGTNIGLDFAIFKSKISGNFTYFEKDTKDMMFVRPVASFTGNPFSVPAPSNVGDISNKGFEASLEIKLVDKDRFKLNLNVNATHYKNEITKLVNPYGNLYYGMEVTAQPKAVGHSFYEYALPEYVGVDSYTGLPTYNVYQEILNTDGEVIGMGEWLGTTTDFTEATKVWTGKKSDPDVYGGFGTNLSYDDFDLSIQFSYSLGGYGFDSVYQGLMAWGENGGNFHKDALNSYDFVNNQSAAIPIILNSSQNLNASSTRWLIKRDYLSLNNITVGYNLNKRWISQIGLKSLRFYAGGQNLMLFSKREGYDPRRAFTGSSNDNAFPYSSSITFGMNIKF